MRRRPHLTPSYLRRRPPLLEQREGGRERSGLCGWDQWWRQGSKRERRRADGKTYRNSNSRSFPFRMVRRSRHLRVIIVTILHIVFVIYVYARKKIWGCLQGDRPPTFPPTHPLLPSLHPNLATAATSKADAFLIACRDSSWLKPITPPRYSSSRTRPPSVPPPLPPVKVRSVGGRSRPVERKY